MTQDSPDTESSSFDPERRPLLDSQPNEDRDVKEVRHLRDRRRLLALACIAIVAADFGDYLAYAPQLAIYQSTICRRFQRTDCNSSDVQRELALVIGWKNTFDELPGVILAIPYGWLADRIGRKPVLILSIIGLLIQEASIRLILWYRDFITPRATWATSSWRIIGGGPQVATSMVYAVITDGFPKDRRTSIFFVVGAAILLGEMLASPISAVLMSRGPWLPSLVGPCIQAFSLLAALLLPERCSPSTSSEDVSCQRVDDHNQENHLDTNAVEEIERHECTDDARSPRTSGFKESGWRERFIKAVSPHVFALNPSTMKVIFAFLFASIGRQAVQFIVQSTASRYAWSISTASLLISIKGTVTLVTLAILLPTIQAFLVKKNMHPTSCDLRIVQISAWIMSLGMLLMAVATRPGLFVTGISFLALGWGFYSALRSLAIALVLDSQVGIVNTTIAFVQSLGTMVAGPILAAAFRAGVNWGGLWLGLPYMVAAGLLIIASVLVCFVRFHVGVAQTAHGSCPS